MKRLNKLIKCKYNIPIYGIKTNSKEVLPGDLFVATHGFNVDHHLYIKDAIEKGAVAVISEKEIDIDVPLVVVKNTNKALPKILKRFYENIENEFTFIGITGTDGKTTTSSIIYQILSKYYKCANIGTNGIYFEDIHITTDNTTPTIEKLYEYLYLLNKKGCKYITMEASSEALLHKRLDNIKYNVGILTNITEDHLNIHKTMSNYINSKSKLFKKSNFCILNIDDKYFDKINNNCKGKVITYGMNKNADYLISDIVVKNNKTEFTINNKYKVKTNLIGIYNIYNITAAFITCYVLNIKEKDIIKEINNIKPIPGRGEKLDFGQNYTIILDYAHTTNGIKNILSTLSVNKNSRIISVTGSAGGREKEKRRKMGKITSDLSDLVIFTMDDPRFENPGDIIKEMTKDLEKNNYLKIIDRKEAIYKALSLANCHDIVVILGKGRDGYMAIKDKKIPYSDYDVIKSFFEN